VKQSHLDSVTGAAKAFLIACLVLMFLGLLSSVANAGNVCRVRLLDGVQTAYAQPQIAPVYYQVGQSLQREAADTLQFRHSEEYIELQQLRGFKAGVDAVAAVSGDRPSSPPQPASLPGHPAATEEGQTTPTATPFEARYPTLAAKCSKCHGGDSPKGDVFIDGSVTLEGPDAASKRDAIAAAIVNGRMPKGGPLDDQTTFNALIEVFSEPAPPEGE